MRILGTVFFLSFLAGKLNAFEQMLLTEPIYKLSACVESSRIFGGKVLGSLSNIYFTAKSNKIAITFGSKSWMMANKS